MPNNDETFDQQSSSPIQEDRAAVEFSARRRLTLGCLAGLALGLAFALVLVRQRIHDPTPALTPEILAATQLRWERNGPADYDIEVQVEGNQPALYRVEVRRGEAVAAQRNGHPLKQLRTLGTWSVPGMFGTMSSDLEQLEKRAAGKANAPTPHLTLRARFNPATGYPEKYLRYEAGSRMQVSWEVIRFEPIGPTSGAQK